MLDSEIGAREDFSGGPVARTSHSQCRGPGLDPLRVHILHATTETQHCERISMFKKI